MHKSTPIAVSLSTLALVGAAVFAWVPSQASSGADGVEPQNVTAQAAPLACDGGAAIRLQTRSQTVPFTFPGTDGSLVPLTGSSLSFVGPTSGKDTLLITFSAETYYTGSGWMTLEVWVDGARIQPYANNGSPFAFASEAKWQAASTQFCTKIGPGRHYMSVRTGTTGNSATDSGWIDDWTLSVQRFA
jgi:hypothetical protein